MIAYYSKMEGKLRMLNIEEGNHDPYWNHSLPTKLAKEGLQNNKDALEEL